MFVRKNSTGLPGLQTRSDPWRKRPLPVPLADTVSKPAVLAGSLTAVAFVAKRLEVVDAPKQGLVSFVRPDVVYVRGGRYLVLLQAFLAQRMRRDVPVTKLLPPIAVASGARVTLVPKSTPLGYGFASSTDFLVPCRTFLFVLLTVLVRQRYGFLTAWVSANMEKRHKRIQANSRENQPGIKNNPVILESSGLRFSRVQKGWPSATPKYETGVFRLLIFHSLRLILFEINSCFISGVKIEDVLEHHARASSLLTKTMPV